jgi:hypothetical protein
MYKVEIAPGVRIPINEVELGIVLRLEKERSIKLEKLTERELPVIKCLLDKSIVIRVKRGVDVYFRLRDRFNIS